MQELTRAFPAMNTQVTVIVVHDEDERERTRAELALRQVEAIFVAHEVALSRFRPESELSRLNRAAGAPFRASPLLLDIVADALDAARTTGGLFDPTVLGALCAAGYDRSFEQITASSAVSATQHGSAACSWRAVRLDRAARTVQLPAGCGLDLGGIAKGWTVDRVAEQLHSFPGFAVDAGGDIRVGGVQADGSLWTVGVEDPRNPQSDLLTLALRDRAVATSTVARRHWRVGDELRHHLIDPRTGRPAESGVVAATVVADSAARAEVLAKAALVAGPRRGIELLTRQHGVTGLLVTADGGLERVADLPEWADAA